MRSWSLLGWILLSSLLGACASRPATEDGPTVGSNTSAAKAPSPEQHPSAPMQELIDQIRGDADGALGTAEELASLGAARRLGQRFFENLVLQRQPEAEDCMLSDAEIELLYRTAIAGILLNGRDRGFQASWDKFALAAGGREVRAGEMELGAVVLADPADGKNAMLTRPVHLMDSIVVPFVAGERSGRVILRNLLATSRGWRALRFHVELPE